MPKDVVMPVLGMAQDEGLLVKWLYPGGATVERGMPLMEIETDKAVVQVDAPASGVLAGVTLAEGQSAPVGTVIARIYEAGEEVPNDGSSGPRDSAVAVHDAAEPSVDYGGGDPNGGDSNRAEPKRGSVDRSTAPSVGHSPSAPTTPSGSWALPAAELGHAAHGPNGRALASPKARRLAQENGLDLALLAGRGPGGAVVAADVTAAVEAGSRGARGAVAQAERAVRLHAQIDVGECLELVERLARYIAEPVELHDLLALLLVRTAAEALGVEATLEVRRWRADGSMISSALAARTRSLGDIRAWRAGTLSASTPQKADLVFYDLSDTPFMRSASGSAWLTVTIGRLQDGPAGGNGAGSTVAFEVSAAESEERLAAALATGFARLVQDPGLLVVEGR